MNGLWQRTTNRIRELLGEVGYETWIGPLAFVGLEDRMVMIEAPNRFFRDWVNEHYLGLMEQALSTEVGEPVEIKLTLGQHVTGRSLANAKGKTKPQNGEERIPKTATFGAWERSALHPQLNPRHTFGEFVTGLSNQFAHAAACTIIKQPGEKYNPLFICGGVGLGKTHLVTAIGHQLWASGSGQRTVLFMPAEVFMNELIGSLRRERMGEFRDKFRRVDALILDDVQFLAGRERTQEEFFRTFDSLHSEHHQIVLTSDKMPRDIPGLEERLRSRFESGLIADVAAPDLETRVAILQKKAALENLKLPPEVVMYIAENACSNVRELEGCLARLTALASLTTTPITIEFARSALHDLVPAREIQPDIETIQGIVSEFFHIKLTDLKSEKRTQRIAFCRQVAMYLCRKLTKSSFPIIGEHFGRDHSTVIHAFNLIQRRVSNDSAFRLSIEKIESALRKVSTPQSRPSNGERPRVEGTAT
jgi:chromosomal replication initiator protein